ncbi:type II toxin-antitoxin system Phd/YefM family antitoxin [Ornithinimicrobium sp. LYQ92]|uniref:type II toxin-antitoxin system Phd/YefM family antitoxin n=1 Tax=Serinicoccus sp. LYQ92 TaxID=3378798 RepID=UPI003854F609
MDEEVAVSEARGQLSELVNRVRFGGERIVLTRHGKGVAALVPLEVLSPHAGDSASGQGSDGQVIDLGSRSTPPRGQIAARTDFDRMPSSRPAAPDDDPGHPPGSLT